MCGIAGIQYKHDVDAAVLDTAAAHFAATLKHRGPDHVGAHRTPRGVFMNLRLAIVDREGGRQPLFAADGRRGIVYNGEVYNHAALRPALQRTHAFRTHTDTEVVLAQWLAHGEAGFSALDGMFAACLWDERDGSLVLVRDRFGAKPLVVYEDAHCIAFASELSALLGLPGLDHALDPVGLQDLLAYRYHLAPHTAFRRIRRLPAGCWLRHAGGASRIEPYAALRVEPADDARSLDELADELDTRLAAAVKAQLMGEVPIGVLLSGGLDSSAVAAYVARAGARLEAYSIGFPEVNEFAYSRAVAQRFGLAMHEVVLTAQQLREGRDGVLARLDEPMADPACFALSRLCEDIRRDVTVVLSGEGGDELFAGYAHHALALDDTLAGDALFAHFFQRSASNLDANRWLRDKAMPLHHLRHRRHFDGAAGKLAAMQQFELATWLPENLMMKADKVLMAHSLEGRFPFLDLGLFDFAARLPDAAKLPAAGQGKQVLRRLMHRLLPAEVVERRKMGFTVPPAFLLEGLQPRLAAALEALRTTAFAEVIDLDAVGQTFERLYAGDAMPLFRPWNLAVATLWWAENYPRACTTRTAPPAAVEVIRPPRAEPSTSASTSTGPAAAPAVPPKRRLVVYTVLVGAKEALADPLAELPAGATTDLELDFVCLTDRPDQPSRTWRLVDIGARHLPAEKLSRRPKAMPHAYFPDDTFSLYVDNTVRFKRLPQASDLATARPYLFRAFKHATRQDPATEASAVAMLAYDEVDTLCDQMAFYATRRALATVTPLTTGTVLLREHHAPAVRRFGELWWDGICTFSKRDQLSLDFSRLEAGCEIEYWSGTTRENPLLAWSGGYAGHRVKASFDATRYAWLHRGDETARHDPRAHYLANAGEHDAQAEAGFAKTVRRLEFACDACASSLGGRVAPRRRLADALQSLLEPVRREGAELLLVSVPGGQGPRGFDDTELDAGVQALAMALQPAAPTAMALAREDLRPDGRAYSAPPRPFDAAVVLGANAAELPLLLAKLRRLLRADEGVFVAVLASPLTLAEATALEAWMRERFGRALEASLHGSSHDADGRLLPNTVFAVSWRGGVPAALASPGGVVRAVAA